MSFSHPYGRQNVMASLNRFLRDNLGKNRPDWLEWSYGTTQPRTLNFYYPDQPLNFPSFSVTHHPSRPMMQFEGDRADTGYKGIWRWGSLEVNCWVLELAVNADGTQTKNEKWMQQLQTMRDMVVLLFEQNRAIALYSFDETGAATPLNALVRVMDIEDEPFLPDPNPAVKRTRVRVTYHWVERWTA